MKTDSEKKVIKLVGSINKPDYSLKGENAKRAVELGLAEADWYQSPIPRATMCRLLTRKNGPAILDTLLLLTVLARAGRFFSEPLGTNNRRAKNEEDRNIYNHTRICTTTLYVEFFKGQLFSGKSMGYKLLYERFITGAFCLNALAPDNLNSMEKILSLRVTTDCFASFGEARNDVTNRFVELTESDSD